MSDAERARVLVIEDDEPFRSQMMRLLSEAGIDAIESIDCVSALERLGREDFDLIVTELSLVIDSSLQSDSNEPNTQHTANVLQWVREIRNVSPRVPIVLMTQEETEPAACEALLQGAASYVPKRLAETTLVETVRQVLKVSRSTATATEIDTCISRVKSTLVLPNHESLVPGVIAKLESILAPLELFDEMVWTQVAMALDEALLNAMIHGNLEVESDLREIDEGKAYYDKIALRREMPPYADRRTEVTVTATRTQAVFVIKDQGPGFDLASLPDPTDPSNLENIGGRGLLLIAAFMDEIHHNECGNELTMIKRKAAAAVDE